VTARQPPGSRGHGGRARTVRARSLHAPVRVTGNDMIFAQKRHSVLPGFGLSLGYTVFYLTLLLFIPLAALFLRSATLSWDAFWATVADPRVVAAYRLSFGTALAAALLNAVFGLLTAWVLVRY